MTDSARSSRPSERRAAARDSVVWDAVRPLVTPGCDVLDIGGGTGGFAVRVAELGARVTVVDPSPDALASLARRAREVDVDVTAHQGDLSTLLDVVGPGSADLVLCHGVLEVVDDPRAALRTLRQVLRPGGRLSLVVAQRHAAVVARAMAGHFPQALGILEGDGRDGRGTRRYTAEEAAQIVADAGFAVEAVHAVRVFADLVPGSLIDLEPGAAASLLELERRVSTRPEYLPLATQLHVLAG